MSQVECTTLPPNIDSVSAAYLISYLVQSWQAFKHFFGTVM